MREQNEALEQELDRLNANSVAERQRIVALEAAVEDTAQSAARFAEQCRTQAEQRRGLEKGLRDATATHSAFQSQLKNANSHIEDGRHKLEQSRARGVESTTRIRALEEELRQVRLTIASLRTRVGNEEELARTVAHLHAEVAKRERASTVQHRALARAREDQERAATEAKAVETELRAKVGTQEHRLERLRAELAAGGSALAVATRDRELSAAMTAALVRLTATLCVRWLGGAAELAVDQFEDEGGALDMRAVAELADGLPLDIAVTATSAQGIQTRPGVNADLDVARLLRSILNKIVKTKNPEGSHESSVTKQPKN